jgi:heptosyltransferase III
VDTDLRLPQRPKILVITLRRLGDVLLTTPLIRTLRRGFPNATLDVLVFSGSHRILQGNPDIDQVLTTPERPSAAQTLATIGRLWWRYDLVVSTQAGDRPTFFALLAGRRRLGLIPRRGSGAWWKRHAYHFPVAAEPDSHRVDELLQLASAIGLPQHRVLVCPEGSSAETIAPREPYAVLHPNPMYRYKRWSDSGWRELAHGLAERGLAVVVTEGRDPAERAYVDKLWPGTDAPVIRERGQLDWAGLAALLKGAAVYVGPDTSITHLSAASSCPTVALYGATSPRLIGPWPVGGLAEAWAHADTVQHRANVWVVQNPLPCMPCERLGCERHLDSHSCCLDELPAAHVLMAVDRALLWGRERKIAPTISEDQQRSGTKPLMQLSGARS